MAEYIKAHPDFVAGVVAWLIVSGFDTNVDRSFWPINLTLRRRAASCGFSGSSFSC